MGKSIAIAILSAALGFAAPLTVFAAGLGKLTILSALGQPLHAEIEVVSLQPGEEEGLNAKLGSPEAFRQAGIEFNPALNSVRFVLERRGNARVLRLTSTQPVSEPFLDLLVELQWPTGRLVREYTFLLDPPGYKGPQPIAAAPAPVAKPAAPEPAKPQAPEPAKPQAPEPAKPQAPEPAKPEAPAAAKPEAPAAEPPAAEAAKPAPPLEAKPLEPAPTPAPEAAAKPAEAAAPGSYEVKKGDTLGAIAYQHMAPGVTLNQMLIAIYRANEDAFLRENVNLVRAGRILKIPENEAIGTVDVAEANRLVKAHADEFNAYRTRLAAVPAPAATGPAERAVEGKIEPKPQPAPPAQQDQLRLSKADPKKPGAPAARAAQEDDRAARERALKEAQSRVTELETNVSDLQKLLELKNQQLAELEKKAAAKPAPVPPVAQAPEKPKPAPEAAKPAAQPPKPAAEAPKPAPEVPKPVPEAAKPPAEAPPPEAKKVPEAAKPKPKPTPPPPPEPSLVDEFLNNPIALGGLGAVLLLLLGYGLWSWRRKKATHARFEDSVLGAAAASGAAFGAASASPAAAPSSAVQPSLSAAPAPGMEGEEVDPIAEADVYMAYGRDAQAEEILKEALHKNRTRSALHAKLLEIYANRRDVKSFEQTAATLKSLTNGAGPEWEKAAALGRSIDPQNGLYGGAAAAAAAPLAAAAAGAAAAVPPAPAAAPALDFDLGGATSQNAALPDISFNEPKKGESSAVDFDLGAAGTPAFGGEEKPFTPEGTLVIGGKEPEKSAGGLDFDLSGEGDSRSPAAAAPAASEPSGGLDFDLDLDLGGGESKPEAEKAPAAAPDLSSISLDLGTPGEPAAEGGTDPKWQEVATKLDLAKAYEEMGDKDGARELLNEVLKDGDAAQKGQAQQILAKLA